MWRIVIACLIFAGCQVSANAEECGREQLTQIVAQAGKALTIINKDKKEAFSARLKELKRKRGWSDKEMLAQAAPIVKNDAVAAFDVKTKSIFARITSLGGDAITPNCDMRDKLEALLSELVENNVSKWALIMDSLEEALRK